MPFCGGVVLFLLMNKVNIWNLLHVFEVLLFGPGVFLDLERVKIGKKINATFNADSSSGDDASFQTKIPRPVTSDHKGSPATLRKGRMVLRDDDFPMECSWQATRSMSLSCSCKFGVRLPIVCRRQSQSRPWYLWSACTAVYSVVLELKESQVLFSS